MKKKKLSNELMKACGKIAFPMTNDAMFHMVFNRNDKALKGFISSLVHMPVSGIKSVEIRNPELFGDGAEDKQYRLDINVLLNDETIIDIEMQVVWNRYWKNRALLYLCSDFVSLKRGEDYLNLKQAIQVGIVNGIPKDKGSGFYSKFKLTNVNTNEEYTDRLIIYMMDLRKIDEATKEDVRWGLTDWAGFLTADTWEEVRMTATNNEYIAEAADTMLLLNSDYYAKKRAQEREDFIVHEKYIDETLKRQKLAIDKKDAEIAKNKAILDEKDAEIAKNKAILDKKDAEIANSKAAIDKKDAEIAKNKAVLEEKDARIAELEALIAKMNK